jgi:hypothetical protein
MGTQPAVIPSTTWAEVPGSLLTSLSTCTQALCCHHVPCYDPERGGKKEGGRKRDEGHTFLVKEGTGGLESSAYYAQNLQAKF